MAHRARRLGGVVAGAETAGELLRDRGLEPHPDPQDPFGGPQCAARQGVLFALRSLWIREAPIR